MTSLVEDVVIPAFTTGDRLRKAREVTGLDMGQFADEIGVSRQTVGNAELDKVKPRKILLKAWSLRTGVPVQWLETGIAPSPDDGDRLHPRQDSNLQPTVLRFPHRLAESA